MDYVISISNGVTITSSMICMSYLYRFHARGEHRQPLSVSIIGLTFLISSLQFLVPGILPALRRDLGALRAGEWWRIATPLLVQPYGWLQFLFNGIFLIVFLPLAERLFGSRVLILYLVPGIAGQAINYAWRPDGGGSSTAVFGVMGGLLMYVCRRRNEVPRQYFAFALLGICGAIVMSFVRDGHGPSLLAGALLAVVLRPEPRSPSSRTSEHLSDASQ